MAKGCLGQEEKNLILGTRFWEQRFWGHLEHLHKLGSVGRVEGDARLACGRPRGKMCVGESAREFECVRVNQ